MKQRHKTLALWLLLVLVAISVYHFRNYTFKGVQEVPFSQFMTAVSNKQVEEITIKEDTFTGKYRPEYEKGAFFKSTGPTNVDTNFINQLMASGTQVNYQRREDAFWPQLLLSWLPMILLFAFFFFSMRQIQVGGGRALSFGRSKARLLTENQKRVTFKDVAGVEEAKEELEEIIAFLKEPKKFTRLGGRIPKGVLLMGSPGTGKTLLARAVAGEAGVPFFSISGSDFVEMFVGVGASVSGDTPVLIRKDGNTKLIPIGEFVDDYYEVDEEGHVVKVKGVQTLGMEPAKTGFRGAPEGSSKMFFGQSDWKDIRAVYRHKVDQIYEIHYLGGTLETTGDHSVFVRDRNMVMAKKVSDLQPGDCLVNLPFKVRSQFIPGVGTTHKIKAHRFPETLPYTTLPIQEEKEDLLEKYQFVMMHRGEIAQAALGEQMGVSQATIGLWQRGVHFPREISKNLTRNPYPPCVAMTPGLMRLFGYYTAEGRNNRSVEFTFGAHETELHRDCIHLLKEHFGVEPVFEKTDDNAFKIRYHSAPLGRFFEHHCGNGSHNKHVPEILWDLPREYFLSYLEGYSKGDGYTSAQESKLVMSSVSKQLILELAWLAGMHGIQVGIGESFLKEGRVIKKKPLPATRYWRLTIGKTAHPFLDPADFPNQFKKPRVEKIVTRPYDGYVYDLCGCEGEAFFGGEKPLLLHNSRVRDLFEQGKKSAPCIIFIDEIDAVGRHRGAGLGGGHDEREQTLNQLLVEMDGFESKEGVIIMAATNRPDVLDPALLRPGRFDRRVVVPRPDVRGREEILKVHSRKTKVAGDVDLATIARGTPGFSGADLENVVNEAALIAARYNKESIEMIDFELAKDKVMMGSERKSMIINDEEKKNTAYHEAGHALVAKMTPGTDPIHKVTIIPRGAALGLTQQLPTDDRYTHNRKFCEDSIAILMGGRAAEELIFDQPTTGAGNDIERATELARKMVCEWGMSEAMGPLAFGQKEEAIFLGKEFSRHQDYSEETAKQIDAEIRKIVQSAFDRAKNILRDNKDKLQGLAEALLEFETLSGDHIDKVLAGEKLMSVDKPAPMPPFQPTAPAPTTEKPKKQRISPVIKPIPTKA